VTPPTPTLREFTTEALEEVTSLDGKVARSVWRLLSRPGFLTIEHNAGRRASYVAPVRLYLVLSLVYFAVAAIAPLNLRFSCSSCPPETREVQERQMGEAIGDWTPRAVFLLVPVFAALILPVARRRPSLHYPQHLYFSVHLHAAWFGMGTVALAAMAIGPAVVSRTVVVAMLAYAWAYFVTALRRVYGLGVGGAVWRSLLVVFIHAIVLFTVLIAIGIVGAGAVPIS
jgi:hypothetical protein